MKCFKKTSFIGLNFNLWFVAILFVGCILSCNKDQTIPPTPKGGDKVAEHSIVGAWQWIKTKEPFSQKTTTPKTEGYSIKRVFEANGTLKHYKNELLQQTANYQLRYKKNDPLKPDSDSSLMLEINGRSEAYFSIENDTLTISRAYLDGSVKYYVRIGNGNRK